MIEKLKIGCRVLKDQVMRIRDEGIDGDNVLDAINFDCRFVEYDQNGQPMREEFEDEARAVSRYDELETWEEPDVMKDLIDSISDYTTWLGVIKNG